MTEHKLIQFNNTQKDLLFWIKEHLINELADMKKDNIEDDFHFKKLKDAKTFGDIKQVAINVKKSVLVFYNRVIGLERFYNFSEEKQFNSITDINSSIFTHDFIEQTLIGSIAESYVVSTKSYVNKLFGYIEKYNIYHEDGSPYLFNITTDIDGKPIVINRLKKYKKIPLWLEDYELKTLKENILKCDDYVKKNIELQRPKDILIIKILIYVGLTSSEIVNLKIKDITSKRIKDKEYLLFNVGSKEPQRREVPIPKKLIIRDLNRYLKVREKQEHDYLFYDKAKNEEQLKTQYVLNTVKKFFRFSKLDMRKAKVDVLRNTYAVTLQNTCKAQRMEINGLMGIEKESRTLEPLLTYADNGLVKATARFDAVDLMIE
jgi:site-specific recombinase XerD